MTTTARKYRAQGLCARCGCICPASRYCPPCREKRAASRKRRNQEKTLAGQCHMCRDKADPGHRLCLAHRLSEKLRAGNSLARKAA